MSKVNIGNVYQVVDPIGLHFCPRNQPGVYILCGPGTNMMLIDIKGNTIFSGFKDYFFIYDSQIVFRTMKCINDKVSSMKVLL